MKTPDQRLDALETTAGQLGCNDSAQESAIAELRRLYGDAMRVMTAQDTELQALRDMKAQFDSLKEEFKKADDRAFRAETRADQAHASAEDLRVEVIQLREALKSYGVSKRLEETSTE